MSIQLRSSVKQFSIPNPPGVLDLFPSLSGGYSFRRLRKEQTVCCRIARRSDSMTMDIGFAYNEGLGDWWVDEQAIINFCGSSVGVLRRWYCQSTNDTAVDYPWWAVTTTGTTQVVYDGTSVLKDAGGRPYFHRPLTGDFNQLDGFNHQGQWDSKAYLAFFTITKPLFSAGTQRCTSVSIYPGSSYRPIINMFPYHYVGSGYTQWIPRLETAPNLATTGAEQLYGTPLDGSSIPDKIHHVAWGDYNAVTPEFPTNGGRGQFMNGMAEKRMAQTKTKALTPTGRYLQLGYVGNPTHFAGDYFECLFANTVAAHADRYNIALNQKTVYEVADGIQLGT